MIMSALKFFKLLTISFAATPWRQTHLIGDDMK